MDVLYSTPLRIDNFALKRGFLFFAEYLYFYTSPPWNYPLGVVRIYLSMYYTVHSNIKQDCQLNFALENSWMQNPRYKHEYLDFSKNLQTVTDDVDESDKR